MDFLLTVAFPGGAIGLLFKLAILCVLVWVAWALLQWSGWEIPRPLYIIGCGIVAIVVIYLLFQLVMTVL